MSNIKVKATEYLNYDLSIIPTKEDKLPALPSWKPYQTERLKADKIDGLFSGTNVKGLAIICGAVSGGLEVIDVDTKHGTTGTLWEELDKLLQDNLPDVYSKLVIARTRSGGYHIYYRCSQIKGNLKLATKQNKEVLIETRGEGGYVIAPPSPGYTYLQGDAGKIQAISQEEREILFSIAKSFNELPEEKPKEYTTAPTPYNSTGLTPFEDYNQRGDIISLLERKGWRAGRQIGQRISLLRPGATDSKTSGNFHTGLRCLRVFSSSTDFNPDKAYSPSSVFALLECNGDNKLAYRKLLELGYGEALKGEKTNPTQIATQRIGVSSVNKVNRETSVISTPGENLEVKQLETAQGEEIVIISPGEEATEEVLKALELAEQTSKRVYVKEGGSEIMGYRYKLNAIFKKYGTIQEETGGLTDRQINNLLDEVVTTSYKLQPLDKDIFLKDFLSQEAIRELGIGEESLSMTVERLTSTRDKEAQAKEFKNLLSEVAELQAVGKVDEALELLNNKVKEVKLKDKATEFSSLFLPIKEVELRDRIKNKPESLNSGYKIGGEDLLLPSGAISVFTAPTSHGKTTFLINLALNVAMQEKAKEVYLFSYEEDKDSILINALNTYQNSPLSGNNRTTLRNHFAGKNRTEIPKKEQFFKDLIETRRLNISYTNYNSDMLIEAIRHLNKNANPGAIFIDYIQLLNLPQGKYKTYSRQEEIKEICIALKDVAVETGLPIILGAQFNREVVNQLRLHATKIGEAGDIERIANLIVGFWNNNFKPLASDAEIREINEKGGNISDTIYATILKNRGGRVGLEEILSFNGNTGKIENSTPSSYFNPHK